MCYRYNYGQILVPGNSVSTMSSLSIPDLTNLANNSKSQRPHQIFVRFEGKHVTTHYKYQMLKIMVILIAGGRWFNVGIQIKSSTLNAANTFVEAEMTFNCHRGRAVIFNKIE